MAWFNIVKQREECCVSATDGLLNGKIFVSLNVKSKKKNVTRKSGRRNRGRGGKTRKEKKVRKI